MSTHGEMGQRRMPPDIRPPTASQGHDHIWMRPTPSQWSRQDCTRHCWMHHPIDCCDRGANGGITGHEMQLSSHDSPERTIDIEGFEHHVTPKLRIGTHGAVGRTNQGEAILVFHQYASHILGSSIHSLLQLEDNGITVDDRPTTLGGSQSIRTPSGHVIPLEFYDGLVRLPLCYFTNEDLDSLPHIIMTREAYWSPRTHDPPD